MISVHTVTLRSHRNMPEKNTAIGQRKSRRKRNSTFTTCIETRVVCVLVEHYLLHCLQVLQYLQYLQFMQYMQHLAHMRYCRYYSR